MFTLAAEPRFSCPVTVAQPGMAAQRFTATFRLLPLDQRTELGATEAGTDELMRLSLVDVTEVQDEAGAPIPFGPELVEALIANPWTRRGLVRAWVEALAGIPSEPAKGN